MLSKDESYELFRELRDEEHRLSTINKQLKELQGQYQRHPWLPRQPQVVNAYDAHLTEEGLVIEVDANLRIRIPPSLMKRVGTLLEMAAMARLMPPDSEPTAEPTGAGPSPQPAP